MNKHLFMPSANHRPFCSDLYNWKINIFLSQLMISCQRWHISERYVYNHWAWGVKCQIGLHNLRSHLITIVPVNIIGYPVHRTPWWRHDLKTFSTLLAPLWGKYTDDLCKIPVIHGIWFWFLSAWIKQASCWWFETSFRTVDAIAMRIIHDTIYHMKYILIVVVS